MRRVMVVGASGSGKSTTARAIGARLGIPVTHLDTVFWQPGWIEPDKAEFAQRVAAIAAGERWVIDGQYSASWTDRACRADTIVWLDLPRRIYLWRVLKRTITLHGRIRPDLAPGCPERFDLPFLRYVWNYPRRSRPKMRERLELERARRTVVILRTQREIDAFLEALPPATAGRVGRVAGTD